MKCVILDWMLDWGVAGRRNAIKDKINQLKKFALVCLLMCYRLDFLLSVEAL